EVALDLAAGPVGGIDDASARGAHLGKLGLDDLPLAECLLGGAAKRDVEDRSVKTEASMAAILGLPAFQHPAHLAIASHDAVLQAERLAGFNRLRDRSLDLRAILRMDDAGEGP